MPIFTKAKIMLPKNQDMSKWSVVACDQYTSEPKYWENVSQTTKGYPSTLNIVFPECFLECPDKDERIKNINKTMEEYINDGTLMQTEPCFVYVERTLANGKVRKGIVGCVDLEEYDFKKNSSSKIRATEKTVLERIPPRVKIRKDAVLELPHIMILIDDEKKEIIESLSKCKEDFEKLYDFELMENSGSIKGYKTDLKHSDEIEDKINKLNDRKVFEEKYGIKDKPVLPLAVGDGNHSLATAKTCYENLKEKYGEKAKEMPARYALCEIVNLHDDSLEFEPIHRVVFNADKEEFLKFLREKYTLSCRESADSFEICHNGEKTSYTIENPDYNLTVGCIQNALDEFIKNNSFVDYIHGDDVVEKLGINENFGILLKCMPKTSLFPTVILDGALPRKTFSMGEACDKRFYLEARKIK